MSKARVPHAGAAQHNIVLCLRASWGSCPGASIRQTASLLGILEHWPTPGLLARAGSGWKLLSPRFLGKKFISLYKRKAAMQIFTWQLLFPSNFRWTFLLVDSLCLATTLGSVCVGWGTFPTVDGDTRHINIATLLLNSCPWWEWISAFCSSNQPSGKLSFARDIVLTNRIPNRKQEQASKNGSFTGLGL